MKKICFDDGWARRAGTPRIGNVKDSPLPGEREGRKRSANENEQN